MLRSPEGPLLPAPEPGPAGPGEGTGPVAVAMPSDSGHPNCCVKRQSSSVTAVAVFSYRWRRSTLSLLAASSVPVAIVTTYSRELMM